MKRLTYPGAVLTATFIITSVTSSADGATLLVPSQFPTIQAAIDASSNGDVIRLANATYGGPGNVNLDFGGRAITVTSANGPDACTINRNNANAFVFDNGETAAARVVGLTITGSHTTGAILSLGSGPTIEDCVFIDNFVDVGGAAIDSNGNGDIAVVRCRFDRCLSEGEQGAAIRHVELFNSMRIEDCVFEENAVGVYLDGASLRVEGTEFRRNTVSSNDDADVCGGAIVALDGIVTITASTFARNRVISTGAPDIGGAAICADDTFLTIRESAFTENTVRIDDPSGDPLSAGGAIYTTGTTSLVRCDLDANAARVFSQTEGVAAGGAIYATGTIDLDSCTLTANIASGERSFGAALYALDPSSLVNCLVADNDGPSLCSSFSGLTSLYVTTTLISSSTIVDRGTCAAVRLFGEGEIRNSIIRGIDAEAIVGGGVIDASYSNITGGVPGVGNIDVEPGFVDAAAGNYRLARYSAGVDAGDGTLLPTDDFDLDDDGDEREPLPFDLDGAPRVADDECQNDARTIPVDMGAHERRDAFEPCDCNDNLIADSVDIADGTSDDCNGNDVPDECEPADCNDNGRPDECDIADDPDLDGNDNGLIDACEIFVDCNENDVNDVADIGSGFSEDCNTNGVPDECDLDSRASTDCNENEVPDDCDIADSTSEDCNRNGLPDECDIDDGDSEDCNDNDIPDECEVADLEDATSPALGPVGGSPLVYVIPDPRQAEGDVLIEVRASADLNLGIEFLTVRLNAVTLGSVFSQGAGFCADPPDVDGLMLTAASFNNILGGAKLAIFTLEPSPKVSPSFCDSFAILRVTYPVEPLNDADGDGVPDDCDQCDADLDGDGSVGFGDLQKLLQAWGPCGVCPEDLDDDGSVGFSDLQILLQSWGACE